MKKIFFSVIFLLFGIVSAESRLDESTIKGELRKPGVKLVAIDFYMTGCPPCDAAIPTWKKLKDNYGDALKLIVVAPKRNDGSCNVKGWNDVDETICDEDQKIAKSWGVKDFPQAFLYSWHNNDPLVQHGHVKDVENAIIKYYKNIPRVAIYADNNSQELVPKVEEELNKHSKIELVSNKSEREQILALKKESHSLKYNDNLKCELGKEISANSILNITKTGNSLTLKLSSVEKSCTMAVTTKELSGESKNLNKEIAIAVYDLMSQMFSNISTPHANAANKQSNFQTGSYSETASDFEIEETEDLVNVSFESTPDGATVFADGNLICDHTPCSKMLSPGKHKIEFKSNCFKDRSETVTIKRDKKQTLALKMEPRYAMIEVDAIDKKSGSHIKETVKVDGKRVGKTPGTFKIPVCSKDLEIKYTYKTTNLSLEENQVKKIIWKEGDLEDIKEWKKDMAVSASMFAIGTALIGAGIGFYVLKEQETDKYNKMADETSAIEAIYSGLSRSEYVAKANKHRKKAGIFLGLEIPAFMVGSAFVVGGGTALIYYAAARYPRPVTASVTPSSDGFYASIDLKF